MTFHFQINMKPFNLSRNLITLLELFLLFQEFIIAKLTMELDSLHKIQCSWMFNVRQNFLEIDNSIASVIMIPDCPRQYH